MDSLDSLPFYELAIEFYTTFLGLRHETGAKYLALGILVPDALTATAKRPLFKVDPASIERHKAAILAYKTRCRAAAKNVKVLSYA